MSRTPLTCLYHACAPETIRGALYTLLAIALALLICGCASVPERTVLHGAGLGSTWSVTLAGPVQVDSATLQRGIQQQVEKVAHQLSRWDATSNLSVLNASPSEDWQPVPPELFAALSYALKLAADTGGAYDPTVAPLVDAWGFGTAGRRFDPPSPAIIAAARARVGWTQVTLDPASQRVRRPAGVQLDLSSMAHGFGADQVSNYLRTLGLQRHLVDVGSEIRAQGDSPEGQPWHVAVEQPPPEESEPPTATASVNSATRSSGHSVRAPNHSADSAPLTPDPTTGSTARISQPLASINSARSSAEPTPTIQILSLQNAAVATSGNYRYFFDYNGRRYSHRIDPRTAAPITHPLASVTVIAPECLHADALATALTVLGPEQGLAYAERHQIAALFIIRTPAGLEQHATTAFGPYLTRLHTK